ncbi:MAG: DUF1566 domain-containing protein [Ferruginibacter sp.]|nr:DUF1566 domain-containing protein [Chitinophagaceae bacterium]
MSQVNSPFKFLDSYQQPDADVFFGREKETTDLYNALSGVKHLMVYGPSGSGKTSLVECGLRNEFSDADWFAITIRKGPDINAGVFAAINKALDEKIELNPDTRMPVDSQIEFGQAVEKLFKERYQPVYLLFDQFEELLISGDAEEKKEFFTQLNKLIRDKVPCRIMLIMREEFIGHLSEFEPLCPSIFQNRFRVEKMGRKNVEEVIYHILEAPRYRAHFNVENSHQLAESILSKLPDRKKEIELAHVQVFLGELWDRAQPTKKNNQLPVLSAELIHDNDDLEGVLESFLKKQIKELESDYGEKVPLELLAAMISERFTKLQVSEAALQHDLEHKKVVSKKPIADLLKELEQRRIIRTIKAGDETQYEISHDVLALVVGQNLTDEMKMREKAGDIYRVYLERLGLFTLADIDYLRPFQQSLSLPPVLQVKMDVSIEFIKKKREEALAKTRKRLRIVYSLLGLALIAIIAAVILFFNADKQKEIAQKALKRNIEFQEKAVGKKYKGGIIFYSDSASEHGLIAAENDLGSTKDSVYNWIEAMNKCDNLILNGYDDWFLPKLDTLKLMYNTIGPGAIAPNTNIGGFSSDQYWSSSESEYYFDKAWSQYFDDGYQNGNPKDDSTFRVRAVRAF